MPTLGIWIVLGGALVEIGLALSLASTYRRKAGRQTEKFIAELADRREIERELAHMASFSELAPNPIIETDTDQKIRYLNPAALNEFPELEKQGWAHPVFEGLSPVLALLRNDKKSVTSRPVKLGEKIYEQQITLFDGGPRVRLYFSDITELKRLDQLKTDFVNMVSHELRSPLTTIQATIKMVAAEVLGAVNEDQKEALALTLKGIGRLSRLINELLDVSKIEAGKLELHCELIDMRALAEEISRNFEPLANERHLRLKVRVPGEPIELFVDRDKMMQVFTNLIQNALKFTEQGEIEISVGLCEEGVRCQINDTGPGIAEKNLSKLFGKFQQVGPAPKGREKGTGLGLSLCKGILELHRGRIWVESQLGKGTQFIFTLPKTGAEAAFKDEVGRLLQAATDTQRPLTLVRFHLDGSSETLLPLLASVVKSTLRVESMILDRPGRSALLALSEVAKKDAQSLAERVCDEFQTAAHLPPSSHPLHVRLAAFPEEGTRPEQLLQQLGVL